MSSKNVNGIACLLSLDELTERCTSTLIVERLELGKLFDEWYSLHPRYLF
jgi:hypothetical protein